MRPPGQDDPDPPLALWIVFIFITFSSLLFALGINSIFEMLMTGQEETSLVQSASE